MKKALVVLSGGQDSTTCLFWAIQKYGVDNVSAITFDYGQRHLREIQAARDVARLAKIHDRHEILIVGDFILKSSSPLTDPTEKLEQYEDHAQMEKVIGNRIEKTFVPMRNALFLTIAANRAVVEGAQHIVTGVCQQDNANYPDCREEFIQSQETMINTALGNDGHKWVSIDTPLMDISKSESILLAVDLPGAFSALAYTHTAYDGKYPPIGKDHASVLRAHGFEEAGFPDPLVMRAVVLGDMEKPSTPNYYEKPWRLASRHLKTELSVLHPSPSFISWWDVL